MDALSPTRGRGQLLEERGSSSSGLGLAVSSRSQTPRTALVARPGRPPGLETA